jgi:DNA-directed RNA polymerase subunit M/transcription elongation factor TFIIS
MATRFEVASYVESDREEKVSSAKPEQSFNDLGPKVMVWNVKTDKGAWWVVEGEGVPMNLYPQGAYFFSSDEVYSFHMGLMARLLTREAHDPELVLRSISFGSTRFVGVRRKLHVASEALATITEPEHAQGIGLTCREVLIELGREILLAREVPADEEAPKNADFKTRARLSLERLAFGRENAEVRNAARRLSDGAWTFASHVTHSPSSTRQDATMCITVTAAVVSLFEQLLEKADQAEGVATCPSCKSRQVDLIDRQVAADKPKETILSCSYCGWFEVITVERPAPVALDVRKRKSSAGAKRRKNATQVPKESKE